MNIHNGSLGEFDPDASIAKLAVANAKESLVHITMSNHRSITNYQKEHKQ